MEQEGSHEKAKAPPKSLDSWVLFSYSLHAKKHRAWLGAVLVRVHALCEHTHGALSRIENEPSGPIALKLVGNKANRGAPFYLPRLSTSTVRGVGEREGGPPHACGFILSLAPFRRIVERVLTLCCL